MCKIFSNLSFLLLTATFILNTACSSGGDSGTSTTPTPTTGTTYSGNTAPAAIDSTNAEPIGRSAGEAVQQAATSTNVPIAIEIGSSSPDMAQINKMVLSTVDSLNQPAGYDIPGVCESGSVTSSFDPMSYTGSGPYDDTITYTNCQFYSSGIIVNGTAIVHFDDLNNLNSAYSITYKDFTVTDPVYGTTTINYSYSCTNLSDYYSCTFSSDFVGSDGVTSSIADYDIYCDPTYGCSGTATFYHGTYGKVTITVNAVTYGSCGSLPDGGDIAFSSTNGSSGTIVFNNNCTVSGTWNTGTTSGSF